ncbi:MAG: ribosome biogenesis factor YjgA [Desulfobacterium sp.]|jgi:ribosome-associated protein|nr:ribosome biogenesis factor YjgA [Desulfobacterium sp.]
MDWDRKGQDQGEEKKSRTKAKLEVEALQRLGERLLDLPVEQITSMEIPDALKKEVLFAKTITRHGAKRRQLQYIGSIMRTIDPETIVAAIDRISMARAVASSRFKAMEEIRNELMEGDDSRIEAFLDENPGADRQRLRQLIRNANQEIAAKKPPKSFRLLFKHIRGILEARDR